MHGLIESARGGKAVAVFGVDAQGLKRVTQKLGKTAAHWVQANAFRAEAGKFCLLPDVQGHLRAVLAGITGQNDIYALAALPFGLPPGRYRTDAATELDHVRAALGWGLGAYRYTRYRKAAREPAQLLVDRATLHTVAPLLDAIARVRDMVNTPTEDMGPPELADEVKQLAQAYRGRYREWVADALLKANFPTVHAVGRASHRAPRLVELTWGKAGAPHLVLVGKGVCFDTGGLDLKTSDGMRWMKKDMGGAAHAIALAELIMRYAMPLRLTLLVPAVENAIGANAYRPGQVIRTRAGITVEVDNTDAEGRLVLCDPLAYAAESNPDLIIDFATLTGAARVALGPDLPALFANRDDLAEALLRSGREEQDQLWRLPLWEPYTSMLDSRIADTGNAGASRLGGAITAALYMKRFVPDAIPWIHLDAYAWNDVDRSGRPQGGEAQGLRAVFAMLRERYS